MKLKKIQKQLKKFNAHTDFRRIFRKNEIIFWISLGFLIATWIIWINHNSTQNLTQTHNAASEIQKKYPLDKLYEHPWRAYTYQENENKQYIEL